MKQNSKKTKQTIKTKAETKSPFKTNLILRDHEAALKSRVVLRKDHS